MIWGIVLAAGRSRRMGQPKALLSAAGATFLHRVVTALREGGCGGVTVVVRGGGDADARRIAAAARVAGAAVALHADAGAEQIHSLRTGLRALDEQVSAAVVAPVDLPGLTGGVVAALIGAFARSDAPVVVPVYGSQHGHPVLFSRAVFPELFLDPLPEGARSVVRAHAAMLEEVVVNEPAVLQDVNTPEDYHRIVRERG